ncbi:MAG: hypothetical protein LIP23_06315, partial [Planctomycetes bacterium]|nr:hypothetical protein [Planctomycetota bacterium]
MRIAAIIVFWLILLVLLYWTRKTRSVVFWPLLALSCLLAFNLFFTPQFYHLDWRDGHLYGVPIDIINHASKVGILACGMTLVIAVGGIDLSVGAVMAIAGAMMAYMNRVMEVAPIYCILAALGLGLLSGMWNGLLVALMGIPPMLATLILMVAGRGIG